MLEGIKVVEYATYMAAPGAGSILSDWGADVVKIEPPAATLSACSLKPSAQTLRTIQFLISTIAAKNPSSSTRRNLKGRNSSESSLQTQTFF